MRPVWQWVRHHSRSHRLPSVSVGNIAWLHSFVGWSPWALLSQPGTWGCHKGMVYLRSVPNPQFSGVALAPICRRQFSYRGCYYPCLGWDRRFHYTNPVSLVFLFSIRFWGGCRWLPQEWPCPWAGFVSPNWRLPLVIPLPKTALEEGHCGHVMSNTATVGHRTIQLPSWFLPVK